MTAIPRPPGPKGHFLLGNLPELKRDRLGFFTTCARRYGDVVSLRLARRQAFLLSHPDDIGYVLLDNHRNFIKNRAFWRHTTALLGQGLLTSEGEFWRHQRHLAAPAFHTERIAAYGAIMVDYTEQLLAGWQAGDVRNVHQDMQALTMRVAAKTLFDTDLESEVAPVRNAFEAVMKEVDKRWLRPIYIPDTVPLPGTRRYLRGVRQLEQIVYRLIEERRQSGEDRGDLLSMLLQARDEAGQPMPEKQVRDEVMTLLLAGHETTALTLSWIWYLLSCHPEAEARLLTELDTVLGGRAPTIADLNRLPYTEAVVLETLRLFPPAWGMGREVVAACEIGGYPIPAGATIYIIQWALHRDPRCFERPEEFIPERWLDGLSQRLPRYAFLPFGGGPRTCIGNRFALMEARLILATIAQRFRLLRCSDQPIKPVPSITLRPEGGVWVMPMRR
ncbi:MAG: cytochrome P450 [Candidatus Competibacteraceae bacterium]